MSSFPALLRASVALLVAGALQLAGAPTAVAAEPTPAATGATASATPRPAPIDLHADARTSTAARGTAAWKLRTLHYYETIPSKWDWSLSTAVAKWNGSGGNLKLVPTTTRSKAKVVISYGNTGTAAGMATVGATPGAWVRLNAKYDKVDSTDAWRRVEVMALFTHELGHVLGFGHTTARCSLMRPVLDISACYVPPTSPAGQYRCRVIDPALVVTFVRAYGGTARYPGSWCLVDPLPSQLSGVTFSGGTSSAVTVRWARPTSLPTGSRVQVRVWPGQTCSVAPAWAESYSAAPTALTWRDSAGGRDGTSCYQLNLVNRYGAGRTAVSRLMAGW
ncbi:MAG: matrixin family metalloprotease [Marmoricola sp.]